MTQETLQVWEWNPETLKFEQPFEYKLGEVVWAADCTRGVVSRQWANMTALQSDIQQNKRPFGYFNPCPLYDYSKVQDQPWYELMWFDYEIYRVIFPKCLIFESTNTFVTEEDSHSSPRPSDWESIRQTGELCVS